MARCGCQSNLCSCVIQSGDGATVSGSGTAEDPYIIGSSTDCNCDVVAGAGATVTGSGSALDPYVIGATGVALTSPRPLYAQVLSFDAPADRIAAAASDPYVWVCDGTNDEAQINLAIDAASPKRTYNGTMPLTAASLGKVELSGGRFNIGGGGIVMRTAVHLTGAGIASTQLRAVTCNQTGMIRLGQNTDHLCEISHLYLHGQSAAGGSCSGIHLNMTGGANTSDYPDSNPDANHHIHDLYVFGFDASLTRNGIWMQGGSGDHNRGNMIKNIQMRSNYANPGGVGIWMNGASDSFIEACHIGGYNENILVAGGNTKLLGNKTYYSDLTGVRVTSGRALIHGHESQDEATGIYLDGVPATGGGFVIDTCDVAGLRVSNDRIQAVPFNVFLRGGGRYATQQRGIYYDGVFANCAIIGNVENANITAPESGTPATGTHLVTIS